MNWNWEAMVFTLAVILGITAFLVGFLAALFYDDGRTTTKHLTRWAISLFILTLITAALAAGLS